MSLSERYRPLLAFRCLHDYYPSRQPKNLIIKPTPQTKRILRKSDAFYQQTENVVTIYYNSNSSISTLATLWNQYPLAFRIDSNDPSFFNFTETPAFTPGSTAVYTLSKTSSADPLQALSVCTQKECFRFNFNTSSSSSIIYVNSWTKENILKLHPDAAGNVTINVHPWGAGLYRIQVSESESQSWFLDNSVSGRVPVGLFLVSGNGLQAFESQDPFPTFTLLFTSRATIWRYYLVGYEKKDEKELRIIDKTGGQNIRSKVSFTEKGTKMFSNQQKALILESSVSTPIALRERPNYHFQLQEGGDVLIDRLAFPSAKLAPGPSDGPFCSEIFIHHP